MALLMVFYQDMKERLVYWFLFPIIAICSGVLFYNNVMSELFKTSLIINVCFVIFLIFIVFAYSKLKLRTSIFDAFGLGDGLLFVALAFTFSSISFLVVFVFGLIFSLVMHLFLNNRSEHKNVPLAGYLSIFFAITYMAHWLGIIKSVYNL
ncbi:hypothetical protein [Winogradskyella sp.]